MTRIRRFRVPQSNQRGIESQLVERVGVGDGGASIEPAWD